MTAASVVKRLIRVGAKIHRPTPERAMTPMPRPVHSQANRLAISFRLAPTAWPMRVTAALWMP